jgi:hypothetical protein
MNGKRAKQLRRAARTIVGPEAPEQLLEVKQQSSKPKIVQLPSGKPFVVSMAIEPRNSLTSVRGLCRHMKASYNKIKQGKRSALDKLDKLALR